MQKIAHRTRKSRKILHLKKQSSSLENSMMGTMSMHKEPPLPNEPPDDDRPPIKEPPEKPVKKKTVKIIKIHPRRSNYDSRTVTKYSVQRF